MAFCRFLLLIALLSAALPPLAVAAQPAPSGSPAPADSLRVRAQRLHFGSIVIDGHVDTPTLMLERGYRIGEKHTPRQGHVDVPRMKEGGLDAAFLSLYVPPGMGEGPRAFAHALRLADVATRQVAATPEAEMAFSAADVRRIAGEGRRAFLMGLEGGHALAGQPTLVDSLYGRGVRYVTLTHINTNTWADASQSPPRWNGLNPLGRRMVAQMNRRGMIVDASHTSDSTFFDVLRLSQAPVLLSHTSCRALVDNVRNASDEMLRALAQNGGVILINFFDGMVNPNLTPAVMEDVHQRMGGRVGNLWNYWNVVYGVKAARGLPGARLGDVADHIAHAVKIAGVDHVGLGSDFDGVFDLPAGLEDVSRLPDLTYELLRRGFSEEDVRKILGGNLLRLMEEVEQTGRALQRHPAPAR